MLMAVGAGEPTAIGFGEQIGVVLVGEGDDMVRMHIPTVTA
jgi:hypothetical protein